MNENKSQTSWGIIISIAGVGVSLLIAAIFLLLPLRADISDVRAELGLKIDALRDDVHDLEVNLIERVTRLEAAQPE